MSTYRKQRSFIDAHAVAQLAALPLSARSPMLGSVSGVISARTAERVLNLPNTGSMFPVTTFGV